MRVIPFKTEHFWAVEVQPAQAYVRQYVEEEELTALEAGNSYSCIEGEEILACFGWVELYPTRAAIWSYLSKNSGPHLIGLTRIAKRLIEGLTFPRLEAEVDFDFEEGHRWLRLLGFTQEIKRLRSFRMDGGDSSLYARFMK